MTTDKASRGSGQKTIKAVETSISIIEALKEQRTATLDELTDVTDMSKANVYRHVTTLREHGFVNREEDRYRFSLRFLNLGGLAREQYVDPQIVKPKVAEIAENTGEVAQFGVIENGRVVVLYKKTGYQGVSLQTRTGTHVPVHQIATGKAIMAHMPDDEVEALVEEHGLPAATENTITTREDLYEELETVRDRGYAVNDNESTKGLYAVAVPINTPDGGVVGACVVSGPEHRMKEERKADEVTELLLSVANEIELDLAYS